MLYIRSGEQMNSSIYADQLDSTRCYRQENIGPSPVFAVNGEVSQHLCSRIQNTLTDSNWGPHYR